MKITLIVAKSNNNCIGVNNTLPWYIPEDFQFFKNYTMGKPVLMGRYTWESLPKKPLPKRKNIILTHCATYKVPEEVEIFSDIKKVLEVYSHCEEICIIGGSKVYRDTIAIATDILVTEVNLYVNGDKFFPEIDLSIWKEISREDKISKNNLKFSLVHFQK